VLASFFPYSISRQARVGFTFLKDRGTVHLHDQLINILFLLSIAHLGLGLKSVERKAQTDKISSFSERSVGSHCKLCSLGFKRLADNRFSRPIRGRRVGCYGCGLGEFPCAPSV
jgi:hypothetical protein